MAKEGDEVDVGKPLFTVEEGAAGNAPAAEKKEEKAEDKKVEKKEEKKEEKKSATPAPEKKAEKPAAPAPTPAKTEKGDRSEKRIKMTRMRQRIAERLMESKNTSAMLTTFQEVDMGNLIDMRNAYKEDFEKTHGVKLGFMSAFVKVCGHHLA